ncbi:cytochrome c [Marinobacterium zhoushanense]|uniref:Cytochrome c n=1 Tax=Marinobacterium zhoushanense TaxID=1679163 RepID=A0ABQ1JZ87_9GAMM|nr:cytochrome C [Marinobacterium zhoushanense]GGB78765.1 cytochrome c [Marinobacterium zhoushanense]
MKALIPLAMSVLIISTGVAAQPATDELDRGRYLIEVGGCNDCHTPGYSQSMGKTAEQDWLLGSDVGFAGPWGVSYAANLRLTADAMTLQQWLDRISAGGLPPMPWPALQAMTEKDKSALFHYIRDLGAKGNASPAALPPGAVITTPYVSLEPIFPEAVASDR